MNTEIGDRIRGVLERHESLSSLSELAGRADMAADDLSKAVSGSRGLGFDELLRLASALGTSFHWLATGEDDPYAIKIAARHEFDHATMTHDSIAWSSARQRVEDIALAYAQVSAADWPVPERRRRVEPLAGSSAEATRQALIDERDGPFVRSFADAVESTFGIDIIRLNDLSGGYSLTLAGRTIIVLSDTSNWFYQNWSLAHELGHIAQGTMEPLNDPDRDVSRRERQANAFAADLLLPRDLMRGVDWKKASAAEVALFLWDTGVSTRTLANRLRSLRYRVPETLVTLLGEATQVVLRTHDALLPAGARLELARRMREASMRRFPVALLAAHREAIAEGRMHAHTLAWMLGTDAESLERELAPARVENPSSVQELAEILGIEI